MTWKRILLSIILLIVLVVAGLYVVSLDWGRQHRTMVDALPAFVPNAPAGQYRLKISGLEFRVRVTGLQNTGPNLLLLHGFPESSIMWAGLMERAEREGLRVVAFDQRGYSPGARPGEVERYQLDTLAQDVVQVADAVGFTRFHLVGHDWGAAVGSKVVMDHPERVDTWTGMAIPHVGAFMNGVLNDPEQTKRSGYFALFKRPWIPEYLLTFANQRGMKKLLANLPEAHRTEYLSILAEPGALTAELNWYRAMDVAKLVGTGSLNKPITRPMLFIWGTNDPVIAPSVIAAQRVYVKGPYQELKLKAGHALIQEEDQAVIDGILAHVRGGK
ncbi:MAG: alpha/beta hydrolase [Cytophagales bacterium]|nr:MAG: alpha/beta hydrolase [Cytophagales bacterium]